MNKDQTNKPTTLISRRTGLDRRWIPSADHQPERRRGSGRRTIRKRSFLEPIALDGPEESSVPFPEIDPGAKTPVANHSVLLLTEKWTPLRPDVVPKKESSDDG